MIDVVLNVADGVVFAVGAFFLFRAAFGDYCRFFAMGWSLRDVRPFALETPFAEKSFIRAYVEKIRIYFVCSSVAQVENPRDYFFAQYHLATSFFVFAWCLSWTFGIVIPFFALGVGLMTFSILFLQAKDQRDSTVKSVGRELPFALDFMGLCFSAGLDLNRSMGLIAGGTTPLSREIARILGASYLGLSRTEALMAFQERIPLASVRQFVMTVIQGAKQGSDIGQTLEQLARAMHTERFQKAEEKAGKISVRMMIPMMVCIMPAVLIMLLGPMLLSYVYANK